MRQRLIFAAFALAAALAACATPSPASADPIAANPAAAGACLRAADATREAMGRCLGAVAEPCIDAEGPSTISYVLCWSAEYDAWRAIIDGAAPSLAALEPGRDPARLATANAAWSAWLDAECEYWAWQEEGGSGEQVDRAQCAARLAADRAIDLRLAARR